MNIKSALIANLSLLIAATGCDDAGPSVGNSHSEPGAIEPTVNQTSGPAGAACTQGSCAGTASDLQAGDTAGAPQDAGAPSVPDGNAGNATKDPSGLPCAVKKVVYERCGSCHSDPPVGTYMPLLTHADFHAASTIDPSRSYAELAVERVLSETEPMPPVSEGPLTADEKATLTAWLDQSAPEGEDQCDEAVGSASEAIDDGRNLDTTGLECHQFLAHEPGDMDAKFELGVAVDSYYVMTFEAPWIDTVQGLVVRPIVDNAQALHHWLLYHEQNEAPGQVGPTSGQHSTGELIHGWAPGGIALDFRKYDDMSIELPAGTYAVEFHYNSSDPNAADASGVEVCYQTETTKNTAGLSWLGYDHGVEGYVSGAVLGTSFSGLCLSPSDLWEGTCVPENDEPIELMFVVPHMHEAGTRMEAVINGPNGSRVLHDEPFDFANQGAYVVNEVLQPGETITTRCYYSEPMCAGQSTGTEMCYLFTYSSPKGALVDNGEWGQLAHGEGTCLGQ